MAPQASRFPGEAMPRRPASPLGADTDLVLTGIGYSVERIAALRASGTI